MVLIAFSNHFRCGSGLSGECLTENGHFWVGIDISRHMLGTFVLVFCWAPWMKGEQLLGVVAIVVLLLAYVVKQGRVSASKRR